ncbi:hypothetical protein NIES4101_84880 [Calothrix sp. NIES-4101]|nr:hypothetical protein NIES4101_84880 [Calothrix sp. NIES-4101]
MKKSMPNRIQFDFPLNSCYARFKLEKYVQKGNGSMIIHDNAKNVYKVDREKLSTW